MVNPFCDSSKVDILKEAFPALHISLIEDKLIAADGDVNRAFDLLLQMTDPSQSAPNGPPLPHRPYEKPLPGRPTGNSSSSDRRNTMHNPFLNVNKAMPAKPLSVREELAQWRQDLREESRQRATNVRNSTASTSNLSFSNMFKSNSSRSSLQERNRDDFLQPTFSVAQPSFQRPLIPTPNTTGHIHTFMQSSSTPNVNYQTLSRSTSNPAYHIPSTSFRPTLSPPALPRRRQSSNSLNHNNNNNPFLTTTPSHRPVPTTPVTNPNHRESSDHDPNSFNPFEEPELPPPAYNEIQRDTVVNLAP